ncbi:UDP-N-acetylglucosamine transferase subunit ALG14 homolog isoform X3 [Carica papaya]|uniref:UDP-N-acetylglucosamine transferase subunit ALG14 homolog isoform X3 n=1 Tax=Carica papaya TaxID=3649 RepID=UPI000B8D13E3|nr:UDP-N-acetylglucosamine transferase subunit ALG14 homolog isoform X3 [Carica papaya]
MYEPLAMDKQSDCFFSAMASSFSITSIIITMATVILFRVLFVIYQTGKPHHHRDSQPLSTLIILGSGGHTAEMLDLLSVLQKNRFKPRFYIAAATDNMSLQKARALENSLADMSEIKDVPQQFMQIYRSREVGQSYVTSVWTTLLALAHALWLMIKIRPQVVLCNGPGTCVPICVIAFLFKVVGIRWSSTFYVESIARVRRLSLSGLVLYKLRIADQIFVQWPQLKSKYPRAHYVGRLM